MNLTVTCTIIMPPPLIGGGIKRCFCLTSDIFCLSDVCLLSVAYIGPQSRTKRPMKTKIGTEIVTRDSDTTFKVKRSRSPGRFTQRGINS